MSRPESFIGAYARNRQATASTADEKSSSSGPVAEQSQNAEMDRIGVEPPKAVEMIAKPTATERPSEARVADPSGKETQLEWTHSVVVSGTVPDDVVWRIDTPVADLPAEPVESGNRIEPTEVEMAVQEKDQVQPRVSEDHVVAISRESAFPDAGFAGSDLPSSEFPVRDFPLPRQIQEPSQDVEEESEAEKINPLVPLTESLAREAFG
ncbi:MAG: hypothetical protein AAGJ83_12760, partial [Planctomycetota bacterium]